MLGKPVLIDLLVVCRLRVVAVGMLAGDIASGLNGSTETARLFAIRSSARLPPPPSCSVSKPGAAARPKPHSAAVTE